MRDGSSILAAVAIVFVCVPLRPAVPYRRNLPVFRHESQRKSGPHGSYGTLEELNTARFAVVFHQRLREEALASIAPCGMAVADDKPAKARERKERRAPNLLIEAQIVDQP
jgi:hypothetical protein